VTPPTFAMPSCGRHFFKGYRWWCRHCRNEAENQFREVCELWWASRVEGTKP
jgi:hypothetical protein